jgi:SAM-dependent methyltransferase
MEDGLTVDLPEDLWGYSKRLRFIHRSIREHFEDRSPDSISVLDIGCGNGTYIALLLARQGFRVTGVDPHQRSIDHANALAATMSNAFFVCGNVEMLPEKSFDVVVLSEVLEHVEDPRGLLRKSSARLDERGLMIVTVPNGYGEFEIDSWIYRKLRLQRLVDRLAKPAPGPIPATHNLASGHVQFFTLGRLRRLFSECSLSIFRQAGSSCLSGPMIGMTLARHPRFIVWNAHVTDRLPMQLASGWFFVLRKCSAGPHT